MGGPTLGDAPRGVLPAFASKESFPNSSFVSQVPPTPPPDRLRCNFTLICVKLNILADDGSLGMRSGGRVKFKVVCLSQRREGAGFPKRKRETRNLQRKDGCFRRIRCRFHRYCLRFPWLRLFFLNHQKCFQTQACGNGKNSQQEVCDSALRTSKRLLSGAPLGGAAMLAPAYHCGDMRHSLGSCSR